MQITVTTTLQENGLFTLDVSPDLELENFKVLCSMEPAAGGLPPDQLEVIHDGKPLADNKLTLSQYGVRSGDVVLVKPSPDSPAATRPQHTPAQPPAARVPDNATPVFDFGSIQVPGQGGGQAGGNRAPGQGERLPDPRTLMQMILDNPEQLAVLRINNPPLAEAAESRDVERFSQVLLRQHQARQAEQLRRMRLLTADQNDPEVQRMIEDEIRQSQVDTNMEEAMEYHPENFGSVTMLYINCKVNGHPIKAFVDSGAQTTIMSKSCAEACKLTRLVDKRFAGIAKGVGIQKILGRVHLCQLQIGNDFLPCSFSVLQDQPMEMLLGLDMLKRHQCTIDLRRNVLVIGTTGTETAFLPENELPMSARMSDEPTEAELKLLGASSKSSQGSERNPGSGASTSSSATSSSAGAIRSILDAPPLNQSGTSSGADQQKVEQLVSMGFPRELATRMLAQFNGNLDQAVAALLAASLPPPPKQGNNNNTKTT